jgi:hypothetical protein
VTGVTDSPLVFSGVCIVHDSCHQSTMCTCLHVFCSVLCSSLRFPCKNNVCKFIKHGQICFWSFYCLDNQTDAEQIHAHVARLWHGKFIM